MIFILKQISVYLNKNIRTRKYFFVCQLSYKQNISIRNNFLVSQLQIKSGISSFAIKNKLLAANL